MTNFFNNFNGRSRIDWKLDIDFENKEYNFSKPSEVVGVVFTMGALLYTTKGKYGDSIIIVNKDSDNNVTSCVWCPASQVEALATIFEDAEAIKKIIDSKIDYTIREYTSKSGNIGYAIEFIEKE